jgi:acyl carrier protein
MLEHAPSLATERIAEIVKSLLPPQTTHSQIMSDTDLRRVGLSSLDMVKVILSLEREFDVSVPDAQITPANFRTIASIETLIDRLRSAHP